jgi:AGCS family alanine or glycine:cation symporter
MYMQILDKIDTFVWGVPLIVLIMGVGIFLTCRLGVLQFRHLGKALKFMVKNEADGEGEVTSFGALSTAMAATIGTGNIVGVATAIMLGGPGALFWMIVAACFGMATKYSEGVLAIRFRELKPDGSALGGPFMYIQNGMGPKFGWLAKLFAIFATLAGLLGIGTITQVNGVASAVQSVFDPNNNHTVHLFGSDYSWAIVVSAIVVAGCTALVVIGGIKRIATVTSVVVPFMAITYVIICVAILIVNINGIPEAVVTVVKSAFGLKAAGGGAVGALLIAMQKGVARGIFSNEAGLGSAPIAAAAAQTKEPVRQGLISMTGTFIDTICICSMTGLTIMVTHAHEAGVEGVEVTMKAFGDGLPWQQGAGSAILAICLAFFAFTTILGWNYYSERALDFLVKGRKGALLTFRWLYVFAVLIGPFLTLAAVWTIADIFNALMAIPNLIALLALNGVIVAETRYFFKRYDKKSGKMLEPRDESKV